jgi:hypothetical protein
MKQNWLKHIAPPISFISKKWIFFLWMISSIFFHGNSQKEIGKNYRKFDERLLHFGFTLGGNTSTFVTFPVLDAYEKYGLKSLVADAQPGGHIGIVTTMKIGHPVVRLRFIPTLSFQEKVLLYRYENPDTSSLFDIVKEQRVNSTNLDFPLMLQFRTVRVNNFAAYVLAGAQYSIDLQSQENASQNFSNPFLKIKKFDMQAQVGGGLEFFAPYFKFGIELKFSQSWLNSLVQDFTPVSKPINGLNNRAWWISLIFEG